MATQGLPAAAVKLSHVPPPATDALVDAQTKLHEEVALHVELVGLEASSHTRGLPAGKRFQFCLLSGRGAPNVFISRAKLATSLYSALVVHAASVIAAAWQLDEASVELRLCGSFM